ncbi:MAG: nucleotide exchange factor GrpE [Verrucomicrobiota bacterium]
MTAGLIVFLNPWPLSPVSLAGTVVCVALGAWLLIIPFVLEYRASIRLTEADHLANVVQQLEHLKQLQTQIAAATGQWQTVQDHCGKAVVAAREIGDRLAAESKDFIAFFEKSNASEKAHLRLEVEKLRRAEMDWIQVVVHILDHVFGLHQAAVKAAQPRVVAQLAQFQQACREIARRVGLVPFAPVPGDPLDPMIHQWSEPNEPPPGASVAETLGQGINYQGQLLRKAMVLLKTDTAKPEKSAPAEQEKSSDQLALY